MKRLLLLAVLASCATDDDGGTDDTAMDPDPVTCPDAPFEHCIVHDNGWTVWCENGVVFANDMTANSYCFPNSHDVACTTGGRSISQQHMCATSCATTQSRYFDYFGDYSNFDFATLCTQ
ncbi:MAG TPA: hypothetical protein VIV11_00530 [Kofleriaceae bacterium]